MQPFVEIMESLLIFLHDDLSVIAFQVNYYTISDYQRGDR
jgi:hypothetical protein